MLLRKCKLISLVCLSASMLMSHSVYANIYDDSIKWEDETNKAKLLESAPKWSFDVITSLFDVYQHPSRSQLPALSNDSLYNVQFINAFWGPKDNPFNKYPRPAKVFVFIGDQSKLYYLSPLVRDEADGNYYVFEKNQKRPMLLNDWITDIRTKHGGQTVLRLNICNGYGNLPTDTCNNKSYQDETRDIYKTMARSNEGMVSAVRAKNKDWTTSANNFSNLNAKLSDSIYNNSIAWQEPESRNALLNTVTTWPNFNVIQDNFEKIRDLRYFDDEREANFLRRISWLYPDDGCWTRAAAVIKDLFGPYTNTVNAYSRPSKVFVFGNLCVNTSNAPSGSVSWWYHTAPIIRDAQTNQTYVLDPSVNPHKPLKMEEWVKVISSETGACAGGSANGVSTFNICSGYGTAPYDSCKDPNRVNYKVEVDSMLGQQSYRNYERKRQTALGRDPNEVLGDLPPWLKK